MTLESIAKKLGLNLECADLALDTQVTGGYASDMLSCVMARARKGNLWVTLQGHPNVVAVAALLELAGIIVTEGTRPDAATIQKAQEQGIPVFTTPKTTFAVVGELFKLGVPSTD